MRCPAEDVPKPPPPPPPDDSEATAGVLGSGVASSVPTLVRGIAAGVKSPTVCTLGSVGS